MIRKDGVKYDSKTRDGRPYRSMQAYRQDADRSMRIGRGKPVDVILESGGSHWYGGAVLVSYESVGDMGGVRFTVRTPEGETLRVSEDRIRPAR